jgi:hypothetical protein
LFDFIAYSSHVCAHSFYLKRYIAIENVKKNPSKRYEPRRPCFITFRQRQLKADILAVRQLFFRRSALFVLPRTGIELILRLAAKILQKDKATILAQTGWRQKKMPLQTKNVKFKLETQFKLKVYVMWEGEQKWDLR